MWNDTVIESVRLHRGPTLDLGIARSRHLADRDDDRTGSPRSTACSTKLKYLPQAERQVRVDEVAARTGLPARSDLMMTRGQLRELRRYGMSVGAHTVSHPILTTLSPDAARAEIVDGRRELKDIIGDPIRLFAYPNGKPVRDYDASHVALVRELGFDAAVSTAWGASDRRADRFQLRRFTPWDAGLTRFGLRLAQNLVRRDDLAPAAV